MGSEKVFKTKCKRLSAIPNIEDIIVHEYLDGAGVKTLATKYNAGQEGAIKNILKYNNITFRNSREAHATTIYANNFSKSRIKIQDAEDIKNIVSMYASGISPDRIGAQYNVNPKTIKGVLKREGISLRTAKESASLDTTKDLKDNNNVAKYGVRNPMQRKDIFDKAMKTGYKFKDHEAGGTKFSQLQGYEPLCIDFLINTLSINPKDIKAGRSKKVPTIQYNKDGKQHVYYPDLYIPKSNLLIEVKSEYTFEYAEDETFIKQKAAKDAGFEHIIIIFDGYGKYLKTIS